MQVTPKIVFHGLDSSPAVEQAVHERIRHLEQFHDRIVSCNVVVETQRKHGPSGNSYRVRVDLAIPGHQIVSGDKTPQNGGHDDVYVAVKDSFDTAQRELEDIVRRMDPKRTKAHPEKMHGSVARLFDHDGFAFIDGDDGREFFFRQESVTSTGGWKKLIPGARVSFTAHEGDKGPYASAVTPD